MATEIQIAASERPRITGRSSRTSSVAGDPRWLALVVLCAGMLMIVLDATIVNVALPRSRAISVSRNRAWPGS